MGGLCCCLEDEEKDVFEPLLNTSKYPAFENVRDVPGAPIEKRWYHGGITETQARNRLFAVAGSGGNGTYLVYDNPTQRGEYVLLVYKNGDLHQWRIIRRKDNKYVLGGDVPGARAHDTVRKLIKYHRGTFGKPIMLEHGGRVTLGNYAYVTD